MRIGDAPVATPGHLGHYGIAVELLARVVGTPPSRLAELMPWSWQAGSAGQCEAA